MKYAGNLTYPDPLILINDLTPADLGVYTRSEDSVQMLHFKKLGISLPYVSGAVKVSKSAYQPGQYKGALIKLDNTCPCEECGYEYGLDIFKVVKQPGVLNSDYDGKARHYGSKLAKVQECTSGLMEDSDLVTMEDDILDLITNDNGIGNDEGAIVDAFRAYALIFTQANISGDAVTFTYTSPAGVATAVTLNGATAEANAILINDDATVGAAVMAVATSATRLHIFGLTEGAKFTLAQSGSALVSSLTRYIYLKSNTLTSKFEVHYEKGFATTTGITMFEFDTTTITASGVSVTFDGNGVWSTATAATGAAALVTELNSDMAASTAYAGSLSGDSSNVFIVALEGEASGVDVKLSAASTLVIDSRVTMEGRYEKMTSDFVFQQFAMAKNAGKLTPLQYGVTPVDGAEYWMIQFQAKGEIGNLHGASHGDSYVTSVTMYIQNKDANFATDIFDASALMTDVGTPDIFFGDFLDTWGGGTTLSDLLELPLT